MQRSCADQPQDGTVAIGAIRRSTEGAVFFAQHRLCHVPSVTRSSTSRRATAPRDLSLQRQAIAAVMSVVDAADMLRCGERSLPRTEVLAAAVGSPQHALPIRIVELRQVGQPRQVDGRHFRRQSSSYALRAGALEHGCVRVRVRVGVFIGWGGDWLMDRTGARPPEPARSDEELTGSALGQSVGACGSDWETHDASAFS